MTRREKALVVRLIRKNINYMVGQYKNSDAERIEYLNKSLPGKLIAFRWLAIDIENDKLRPWIERKVVKIRELRDQRMRERGI